MLNATLFFFKQQATSEIEKVLCFNTFKFLASQVRHKKCKCPAPWHFSLSLFFNLALLKK